MRLFLKQTLLLIIITFIIVIIIDVCLILNDRRKTNFELPNNPKYIVVGHSHSECAYNDSLISDFKNIAQSGDAYFYTYFKAKKVIEDNPSIEVIFIEFENDQIRRKRDSEGIWSKKYMEYKYPKYACFMSFSDNFLLFRKNPFSYLNSVSFSVQTMVNKIKTNNYLFSAEYGGYNFSTRNKVDSLLQCFNNQSDNKNDERFSEISEYDIHYLSTLIKYCKQYNKKVILVRSPVHKYYEFLSNESEYQETRKTKYSDVEYLDFSKFPLAESEFGDFDHLNYKGARIFSIWFENLLQSGIIEKKDKQKIIDSLISKESLKNEN